MLDLILYWKACKYKQYEEIYIYVCIYIYNKKVVYLCVTPHYIYITKARVLNIKVFYNNNLFENWKLYTIKNSQHLDACSASYSCDQRNNKIVTM